MVRQKCSGIRRSYLARYENKTHDWNKPSLIGQALFSIVIVYDNHEVLFLTKANKYKKSIIYLAEGG